MFFSFSLFFVVLSIKRFYFAIIAFRTRITIAYTGRRKSFRKKQKKKADPR